MLDITQLLTAVKHLFTDKSYGESLQDFIAQHNPKTPSDIEHLERKWQYDRHSGGHWL